MKPQLFVMVKVPQPGRVKTRLGRDIGNVAAAWWFRHQVRHLLRKVQDPRWQTILAVAPDAEGMRSRVWPSDVPRVTQGPGNLGDRMKRLLQGATGPACIIGADIPDVSAPHVAQAFAALGQSDAVFGPAPDGGFWLIGLKRTKAVPKGLFDGVRWSTRFALADTKASLQGVKISQIAELQDVDTIEDLRRFNPGTGERG